MGISVDTQNYSWAGLDGANILVNNLTYFYTNGSNKYLNQWFGKSVNNPREADIIIFCDGPDVNPALSNQILYSTISVNDHSKQKDQEEIRIYLNNLDKPKLGISRGAILLGVMNGAKIIQHVNNHLKTHTIITSDNSTLKTTSYHTHMLNVQGCPNATLLAWSYESEIYKGDDSLLLIPGTKFKEPEIVYFEATKSLCIQGRPDWPAENSHTVSYINELIENLIYGIL